MPADDAESLSFILQLIRSGDAKGRPAIERVSGYGRGLVSERVGQLLRSGVVVEGKLGVSTGGRAARELEFKANAGIILVCYANLTEAHIGLADLSGRLLENSKVRVEFAAGPEKMFAAAENEWSRLLDLKGLSRSGVWGMGIGLPAHSEFATASLIDSPSLPSTWRDYPLRELLSNRFGCPVWLETVDNVLALGELRAGVARRIEDFVYLNADLAIGCGIVVGGKVIQGAQGAAGNVGHIFVGGDDSCRCGRRGCLEAVASGEALLRAAERAGRSGESIFFKDRLNVVATLEISDLAEALRNGDSTAQRLVAMSGTYIGQVLGATINVLNPSLVVAGGCLPQLGPLFLACMREAIYRHSLPFVTKDLRIVSVEQTDEIGSRGAAQLVIDQIFSANCLASWWPGGRPTPAIHAFGH